MPKLFSYVVHHDLGYAPHPFGRLCTLAKCKYGSSKKRNIVEMAEKGDWIAGTGGADLTKSAGHGRLIYAMRVDEKMPLAQYQAIYQKRIDAKRDFHEDGSYVNVDDRYALISRHFFYFGRNAIDISEIPRKHLYHPFEKKGPGYRCDFTEEFIEGFVAWLEDAFKVGIHGSPCKPHSDFRTPGCLSKVGRTRCTQ